MFSIRGLRLYFPELEPWVVWSALLPTVCPAYLCANVGPRGATRRSACPVLCHSDSGPRFICVNVGPQGLLAVAVLAPFVPQSTKSLGLALLVYLCVNVGPRGLLAVSLPALFIPQSAMSLGLATLL